MRLFIVLASLLLLQCTTSPIDPIYASMGTGAAEARKPASAKILDKSGYLYDPADRSCDGFPRLQVDTMPGTCLGLVLPQSSARTDDKPWIMPRTLAQVPGSKEFFAVDMGGWAENRGALYLLRLNANGVYENVLLKSGLNMPHEVKLGPDGFFYLGESQQVSRFHYSEGKIRNWELVVAKLPRYKGYMHPLVAIAFDPRNGDMYLNSGAPSDHCFVKNHGSYSDCPEDTEAGLGAIYRVPGDKLKAVPAGGLQLYEIAAHGLRNSMAMEVHPSGMLVQGENGRDFPQLEEPYEEINAVDLTENMRGKHFGWPYCYDFHAVSPEWKFSQNLGDPLHKRFSAPVDCSAKAAAGPQEYQAPHILMPPHSAPLHLGYYGEGMLAPLLRGKLLVTWHGYQPTGHRIVAYNVDSRGLPRTVAVSGKETYSFDQKGACPTRKPFKPEGGLDRFSPYQEVVSRWDEVKGVRPKGAPVGFTLAEDGAIWIAEDKNRTIVRLAKFEGSTTSSCNNPGGNGNDPRIELLTWRNYLENNPAAKAGYESVRDGLLKKYCSSCHGGFAEKDIASDGYSELDYLVKNELFQGKNALASKIYQALAHSGEVPAMPPADVAFPDGASGAALLSGVKAWIELLPSDLEKAVKKTTLTEARKLRQQPGNDSKVCGQFGSGDVVYVDPRPEAAIQKDGWSWAKTYVIPSDSRLFRNACPQPADGVYYMAVSKL